MPTAAPLHPVEIGRTPAGILWTCWPHHTHTAETFALDVAEMREAFASVCRAQRVAALPALLPTLTPGQRIVIASERVAGGHVQEHHFTVVGVAPGSLHLPAGALVDLEEADGTWAALVVRQARGTVALIGTRIERTAIDVRLVDEMAVAS